MSENQLYLSHEVLVVPCVVGKPLALDMKKIHKAESRLIELCAVTKAKAGELMYTLNEALSDARDNYALIKHQFGCWKQKLRTTRGLVILDRAQDLLKDKGLASTRSPAGSADLREAVVDTDPTYLDVTDKLLQVEAALDHVGNKVEKLKTAYFAVRDLTMGQDSKRSTSGGVGDDEPGALTGQERIEAFVKTLGPITEEDTESGFGTTKI